MSHHPEKNTPTQGPPVSSVPDLPKSCSCSLATEDPTVILYPAMTEIIFLVESDNDSGYIAQALGESIITQADDLEILRKEVKDAVHCHFPDEKLRPKNIRLRIVQEELLAS